jgi:hypothetical protein
MNNFVVEIWDDQSDKVTYYTVRKTGETVSETDKFFERYSDQAAYREHVDELISFLLKSMGDQLGARECFFRHERNAHAVPPVHLNTLKISFQGFPLRLYCLRLTDHMVILMNGGVKTSRTAQDSPDLVHSFGEANRFAKVIDRAIIDRDCFVSIDGRSLLPSFEKESLTFDL